MGEKWENVAVINIFRRQSGDGRQYTDSVVSAADGGGQGELNAPGSDFPAFYAPGRINSLTDISGDWRREVRECGRGYLLSVGANSEQACDAVAVFSAVDAV